MCYSPGVASRSVSPVGLRLEYSVPRIDLRQIRPTGEGASASTEMQQEHRRRGQGYCEEEQRDPVFQFSYSSCFAAVPVVSHKYISFCPAFCRQGKFSQGSFARGLRRQYVGFVKRGALFHAMIHGSKSQFIRGWIIYLRRRCLAMALGWARSMIEAARSPVEGFRASPCQSQLAGLHRAYGIAGIRSFRAGVCSKANSSIANGCKLRSRRCSRTSFRP